MKTWIIRRYIALAEAFDWPIPDWIRHWLPSGRVDAMIAEETSLTDMLRSGSHSAPEKPENLEFLIESRLASARRVERPSRNPFAVLVPVSAIAAMAALGFYLILVPGGESPPAPPVAVTEPAETMAQPETQPAVGGAFALLGDEDILLRPLAQEKERLTADLTGALKYVARGIVPDPYVDRVNDRLDALNADFKASSG